MKSVHRGSITPNTVQLNNRRAFPFSQFYASFPDNTSLSLFHFSHDYTLFSLFSLLLVLLSGLFSEIFTLIYAELYANQLRSPEFVFSVIMG